MKRILALAAAGLFALSTTALAGSDCDGVKTKSVSAPQSTTTAEAPAPQTPAPGTQKGG